MLDAKFTIRIYEKYKDDFIDSINEVYSNNTIEEEEIKGTKSYNYGTEYKLIVSIKTRQRLGAFLSQIYGFNSCSFDGINFKSITYKKNFINNVKFTYIPSPYAFDSNNDKLQINFNLGNKKIEFSDYSWCWLKSNSIGYFLEEAINR